MGLNIGFVSFRFAGTDGVSLETGKWAEILEEMGHRCFYFGGELYVPEGTGYLTEKAHFQHPEIRDLYARCFTTSIRDPETTELLHEYRRELKQEIYLFAERYNIDLLIPENCLTIPLNIPLGLALKDFIAETGCRTIAHHHDFFWERKRFLRNCVWDYLNSAYPPHLPTIEHAVINTSGQNQLALRTGISSIMVPNVMDFENPPNGLDDFNADARRSLGIAEDEYLILQPTRVVQRKGIEHAIELVARLKLNATLVISHASGDEGYEYQKRVQEFAQLLGVKALFVQDIIADRRGRTKDGRKIYSLFDIYPHADLVTYPSLFEGFGNAFLEAIYYKKPILVNNYSIYSFDIKPKGFDVIEIDNFISEEIAEYTRNLILDKNRIKTMVEKNYALGLKYYSYRILRTKLDLLLTYFYGK